MNTRIARFSGEHRCHVAMAVGVVFAASLPSH
jgi:hypothetical protein